MCNTERKFVNWLKEQQKPARTTTELGIGDDMAGVAPGAETIWITADMLLDGVHFDTKTQSLQDIGRKAVAASLSDCAGMCVEPIAATVCVALPSDFSREDVVRLHEGMKSMASEFDCDIVGGDTTRWNHPLVIDVAMLARPWTGIAPRRRDQAREGDTICVTGKLGGSLSGHHLNFTPRVKEAFNIASQLDDSLHAMMDISDGISLDLSRLCEASGTGAELNEKELLKVASEAANSGSASDGRSVLDHVMNDGEDFELLVTVGIVDEPLLKSVGLQPIGRINKQGMILKMVSGVKKHIEAKGYDHFNE